MARTLREAGFDAAALEGGFAAWRAAHPVEPKQSRLAPEPHVVAEP